MRQFGSQTKSRLPLHRAEFSDHRPFQWGQGIPMERLTAPQQKHVQRQRMFVCVCVVIAESMGRTSRHPPGVA